MKLLKIFIMEKQDFDSVYAVFGTKYGSIDNYEVVLEELYERSEDDEYTEDYQMYS